MASEEGLTAGVAICFLLMVVCVVFIVFLAYRRYKRKKGDKYKKRDEESHRPLQRDEAPIIKETPKGPVNGAYPIPNLQPGTKATKPDIATAKPAPQRKPDVVPMKTSAPKTTQNEEHGPEDYYNLDAVAKPSTTAVKIDHLPDLVKRRNKEKQPFNDEFDKLVKDKDPSISWAYAEKEELKSQNRFKNIIPYDHTRVHLTVRGNDPLSDYVNASFIDGYEKPKAFIACHGPVERTMPGVWRMIWEYKVKKIVMVTNFTEYSTMKVNCEQYWPNTGQKTYGVITVNMTSEESYADFIIRRFNLTHEEEKGHRIVEHYHYTSWPDHGVPENTGSLLKIRRLAKPDKKSPIPVVVHCRAGIGRTGTFIALDYLLDEAKATGQIDIFNCVKKMRRQRINMVQTQVQYAFLYDVLNEALMFGETASTNTEFPSYCKKKMQGNPSGLDKEFKLLEETKPIFTAEAMEEAQADSNKSKNRDPKVLPSSRYRAFFVSMEDGSNPYFNAVSVKGYKAEIGYYATQVPLQNTVDLFWKFVQEQQIKSIVCLQNSTDGAKWFPKSSDDIVRGGSISVGCTDTSEKKGIMIYDLLLSAQAQEGALYANTGGQAPADETSSNVRLLYVRDWANQSLGSRNKMCFMDIRDEVSRFQGKDDKPILVVCLNGAHESGLYIASSYLTEMANCEQEVDVAQVIKQIRISRPQFITNKEQYKFIHEVMLEHLQTYNTYSNY